MKHLASIIVSASCGLVFGLGALISGMANPAKVLSFFDVAGKWDPSLALVMGSALAVTFIGYRFLLGSQTPVLTAKQILPTRTDIDTPLIVGAIIFGVGWGLGGLCPGPALAALFIGGDSLFTFASAMVAGIVLAKFADRVRTNRALAE